MVVWQRRAAQQALQFAMVCGNSSFDSQPIDIPFPGLPFLQEALQMVGCLIDNIIRDIT